GSSNNTATLSVTASTSTTGIVTTTNACTNASANYTITVTPTPTVTVDLTNISLCTGQSATVTATSSEGNYLWQPGGATTNTLSVNTAGVYTVTTTNTCFTTTATTSVTINSSPSLTISSTSNSLCAGGQLSSDLSLNGSTGTYSWSTGASTSSVSVTTPGVYMATVTTTSCGSANASFTIAAISTPTITSLTSSSPLLCNGVSATLTVSDNMSNEVWSNGAVNTPSIIVNGSGTYTVGVSNACGSPTASIVIQSNVTPNLTLTSSSNTLCPNETATLTVSGGSVPYSWSNSSNTGSVVTTNGGTVTVSSTNACGTGTASVVVSVTNLNASIAADPTSGIMPVVTSFTNNSTGATSYAWSFGNGNTASTQTVNPQTYSVPGTYEVYLTAFNGSCFDTDSLTITVLNENPWMVIPNVFTPNNDSINDVFRVTGLNITEFSCTIFDRWGLQMFAWDGIKNGWNGKSNERISLPHLKLFLGHVL
ncbi:MAG: gliding motility-associated C-terminal domain-containing protein, partial [Bacteroidetes bacterium]|nr:gliding motility-associated C-terminal domain-containing protein [Bacteroidota bacterium]